VAALHVDVKVRRGLQERLVVAADSVEALVVLGPRFVVVEAGRAEGGHQTVEIVRVLQPDMLFNLPQAACCQGFHVSPYCKKASRW